MAEYVLNLGYKKPPLRENDRMHWRQKSPITKSVREVTRFRAKAAGIPRLGVVEVVLFWHVTDKIRRDSAAPNPTLKAAIDGLVDAGILTDDNHLIVRRSWCEIEEADKPAVLLVITELEKAV